MTRTADHLFVTESGSVHAAAHGSRLYHVLACNGRSVTALRWSRQGEQSRAALLAGRITSPTCKACLAGIASGRIVMEDAK